MLKWLSFGDVGKGIGEGMNDPTSATPKWVEHAHELL